MIEFIIGTVDETKLGLNKKTYLGSLIGFYGRSRYSNLGGPFDGISLGQED